MKIYRPRVERRKMLLLIFVIILLLLAFFPAVAIQMPATRGSLCEQVDKLCVSAVTYQAEIALKNQVEILHCVPGRDGIRCFDPYSTLKKRQFWNISVIHGCSGGDCIRAISPAARIARSRVP